ncbi:MAG: hypothetical protein ACRD4O_15255, partial [Bryobacteraceae bacterium]
MAQIAKAVVEIEQVTQRAAAGSEETASASEELSAQAEAIRALVEGVRQLAGGGGRVPARRPGAARRVGPGAPRVSRLAVAPARGEASARSDFGGRFEPVSAAAARARREPFPLDGDFKEF